MRSEDRQLYIKNKLRYTHGRHNDPPTSVIPKDIVKKLSFYFENEAKIGAMSTRIIYIDDDNFLLSKKDSMIFSNVLENYPDLKEYLVSAYHHNVELCLRICKVLNYRLPDDKRI